MFMHSAIVSCYFHLKQEELDTPPSHLSLFMPGGDLPDRFSEKQGKLLERSVRKAQAAAESARKEEAREKTETKKGTEGIPTEIYLYITKDKTSLIAALGALGALLGVLVYKSSSVKSQQQHEMIAGGKSKRKNLKKRG
eukprot:GHVN01031541.1.p2 GENE.GHVN01031541.1~~GHVN01031541.1.p2  ORF type:complete len:139 (+),score=21.53 GHVN01031541.1:1-417(+)